MILVNSYLEAAVTHNSRKSSLDTHVEGLRFLILISESLPGPPTPLLPFGLPSLGSWTYSWYLSIKSSPVLAITVLLFISCCGKLFWQSAVMNHLAKAFGKEGFRSHRPLFHGVGEKKQHSIHFSCSFMSPAAFFVSYTQCFKSYSLQTLFFSSRWASQSKYLAGLVHKGSAFTCLRCWRQGTLCYVVGLEKQNFAG